MKKVLLAMVAAAALCGCKSGISYTLTVKAPEVAEVHLLAADESMDELAEPLYDETTETFVFEGKSELPAVAYLVDEYENPLSIIFIENGDISVVYDETTDDYIVSGTPANDGYMNDGTKLSDMIQEFFAENIDNDPPQDEMEAFMKAYYNTADEIVARNNNIFGAYLFTNTADAHLTPAEIIDRIGQFPEDVQKTAFLKALKSAAEANLKTDNGSAYIDITAPDTEGREVSLSSVVNDGKWVLVDFWATWCGPCRGELPYLSAAYAKYADKGFEIYGVSLDNNREAWKAFVAENGMTWVNVIDVRDDKTSPASELYGVRTIPTNYLISPEGVIVAKNLRGDAVDEKLAEIFE